jgi:drug/metabolite transporter (DMT)-like permease
MNWKKFFFAFIAAFIFLFVFGFVWYATLMHDAHREVPTLLRPEADQKSYFGWLALGQFVMAFFFTLLCASYVPSGRAGGRCDAGDSGGVSVCRATFDLIRSPTINL